MDYIFENWNALDYTLLYKYIIGFFIFFGTLVLKILNNEPKRFLNNDKFLLVFMTLLLLFFSGTRGLNIGTDTLNYYREFYLKAIAVDNFYGKWLVLDTDFLFKILVVLTSYIHNFSFFLSLIALLFFTSIFLFIRKFTNYGNKGSSLILFLTMASGFSFLGLQINIMRNGLAISFLLLSLSYIMDFEFKRGVVVLFFSFLFHESVLIPIILMIIIYLSRKISMRYFIVLYIFSIIISFLGYGLQSFSFIQSSALNDLKNLKTEVAYDLGFRIDFVLYNSFFLILFLYLNKYKNIFNTYLIRYYILSSIVFFLCFHIIFSDRFGLYSWCVIPLLLFNLIGKNYPRQKLTIGTIALVFYFFLNITLY